MPSLGWSHVLHLTKTTPLWSQDSLPGGCVDRRGKGPFPFTCACLPDVGQVTLVGPTIASPSVFPEWVETDSGFFFSFLFAVRGGGSCPLSNSKFLLFLELPLRGRTAGKPSWRLCLLACWHVLASPSCLGILEFQACVRGAWSVAGLLTPTFLLANVKLTWRQ